MRAHDVEVVLHFATIQGIQRLQVARSSVETPEWWRGRTQGAEHNLGRGVASLCSGVASLEQWQIRRRTDVVGTSLSARFCSFHNSYILILPA